MAIIPVSTMHTGINFKDNPVALTDGSVKESIGFDLTKEGSLITCPVFSDNEISNKLPSSGNIVWIEAIHTNGYEWYLATTENGLYANGTLIHAGVQGRFKAVAVMDQIYIVTPTMAVRYDPTVAAAYQLGITAPTSVPVFSASANVYQTIDTFEGALTDWIANAVNCTCSAESTIVKVGSKSLKFALAADKIAYSFDDLAVNCALLSDASVSPDDDLVHFYLYVDNLSYLDELHIQFDLLGSSFNKDFYSYTIALPGNSMASLSLTPNQATSVVSEDTIASSPSGMTYQEAVNEYYSYLTTSGGQETQDESVLAVLRGGTTASSPTGSVVVTKNIQSNLQPGATDVLENQSYTYWHRNDLVTLQSGAWCLIEVPKNYFVRYGEDTTKTWADVKAVRFKAASRKGAVNFYVDDLKLVGGGNLKGDYWFIYSWGRRNTAGTLMNWSSAARTGGVVSIAGPVTFNRQKLVYASRPLSTDAQVDCGLFYMIGGNMRDWKLAYTVLDNTTTSGTVDISEDSITRLGVAWRNEPAPGGEDIIYKYGRLWIAGVEGAVSALACSEISSDGDVLLEAWPPGNVWVAEGEKKLVSLSDFGSSSPLIVRGWNGEYQMEMADPADLTTVVPLVKLSSYGTQSRTAKVPYEDGELFPSTNTFVVGTSSGSQATMPEFSNVITEYNMQDAVGMTLGWVSYFSFRDQNGVGRLIAADRFKETIRIATLTNKQCECLFMDPSSKVPYAVYQGQVYKFGRVYSGDEFDLDILSKGYTTEEQNPVVWQRIEFNHNTGGQWLRCYVYVDGVEVGYLPFRSTKLRKTSYWFGPTEGSSLQFSFKGQYKAQVEIQLPIWIHHV